MIHLENKSECSGCSACEHVCRHGALKMHPDGMGFLYPDIDEDKCVGCNLCDMVCTFHNKSLSWGGKPLKAYALKHKDMLEVERSQSGGGFAALSDYVLSIGGTVYGAGYDDELYILHKRASNPEARDGFRGSKYVQSDMRRVYSQIREDLQTGKTVLFSGTPCQTAAVRRVFGESFGERLLLVDLICHGVASPGIWRDYVGYLESRHHDKIVDAKFRDKKFGWHSHRESYTFTSGKTIYPRFLVYIPMFMRPACGGCKYSTIRRCSDITIGDFWGVENVFPDFETENKGCSLVLCNTEKGVHLLEHIKPNVLHREVAEMKDVLQPNLISGTILPNGHDEFADYYGLHGFRKTMWRYGYLGPKSVARRLLRKIKGKLKSIGHK